MSRAKQRNNDAKLQKFRCHTICPRFILYAPKGNILSLVEKNNRGCSFDLAKPAADLKMQKLRRESHHFVTKPFN